MMKQTSEPINDVVSEALRDYADMVRRICSMYLRQREDVEDVFQDVFLKLLQVDKPFDSEEHKKAWLCRITINRCKDLCKAFWRRNVGSLEEMEIPCEDQEESDVLLAVLSLPPKLKDVIYLFYYEEYTAGEIAHLLGQKENTVYSHLHRAKEILRHKLGGSAYESAF